MKLSKAVDLFLTGVRADGLSEETYAWYRKRLRRFFYYFEDADLDNLTTDDLRLFVASLRDQNVKYQNHHFHKPIPGGLSPSTLQAYVRIVKRLFTWLEQNGHIEHNIGAKLKKPSLPKSPPKEISIENLKALLETARQTGAFPKRDYALILLLADSGCRKAGALGLRVSDLLLDQNCAFVTEKGRKARYIFFSSITKKALKEWLEVRPQKTDLVFVGQRGGLGAYGINLILARVKKRAGVTGRVNPHSFRHFFAKSYLTNGGDLASLADLMGHSSVEVTKNSYSIFLTEELRRKHREHNPLAGIV